MRTPLHFYRSLLLVFVLMVPFLGQAQEKIPTVPLKKLNGAVISSDSIQNGGKPIVLSFWATWCKPCIRELNAIDDWYGQWQEETGVKLVAISIDDSRNSSRVRPFVASQGWDYQVYLDENQALKRGLNVNNIPHTFLLNGQGEVVWQHTGYMPGDEAHLYEMIQKVAAGKSLD